MPSTVDKEWYSDGLRFHCLKDCGVCCVTHEDYAYVYLQDHEIRSIAEFLGIGVDQFLEDYTFEEDGWQVLHMDTPHCPFLDGTCCSIHPARPVQCRTFPFWEEFLESRESWEKLKSFCPGIDRGRKYSTAYIRKQLELRETD